MRKALYASKVVAYAQGFEQMTAAAKSEGWELHMGELATIWRGGCIIRARFLDRIREAYDTDPDTPNLLLVDYFRDAVADAQDSWRRVISHSIDIGVPVPAFTSSLAYYDGYRRERGPASLIQGLRDLFGAHTYRRVDAEGTLPRALGPGRRRGAHRRLADWTDVPVRGGAAPAASVGRCRARIARLARSSRLLVAARPRGGAPRTAAG